MRDRGTDPSPEPPVMRIPPGVSGTLQTPGVVARQWAKRKESEMAKRAKPGTLSEEERKRRKALYNKRYQEKRKALAGGGALKRKRELAPRNPNPPLGITLRAGLVRITVSTEGDATLIRIDPVQ